MRLGWMFKSESVVIPAFIDVYTSSGTIRGLLPLILRIGQSLPQFLVAQRVAQMPKKQGSSFSQDSVLPSLGACCP